MQNIKIVIVDIDGVLSIFVWFKKYRKKSSGVSRLYTALPIT